MQVSSLRLKLLEKYNLFVSVAILDGMGPIVTNVSNCLAVLIMVFAPNPWNVNANPDGLVIFAINPFVVKDAMKPLDIVPNLVSVGVAWDGLGLIVRLVFLTPDAKMDSVSNLGNVNVLEVIKDGCVIQNRIPTNIPNIPKLGIPMSLKF